MFSLVIQWMLETWRGRVGRAATIQGFITILQEENLNLTAGKFQFHYKS
jgi:hypothetical protein